MAEMWIITCCVLGACSCHMLRLVWSNRRWVLVAPDLCMRHTTSSCLLKPHCGQLLNPGEGGA